jgi:predicted SAM-dependent methyltransferase
MKKDINNYQKYWKNFKYDLDFWEKDACIRLFPLLKEKKVWKICEIWVSIWRFLKILNNAWIWKQYFWIDIFEAKNKAINFNYIKWDARNLNNIEDNNFDFTFSLWVIEHFKPKDTKKMFNEHIRITKNWWIIFITVPHFTFETFFRIPYYYYHKYILKDNYLWSWNRMMNFWRFILFSEFKNILRDIKNVEIIEKWCYGSSFYLLEKYFPKFYKNIWSKMFPVNKYWSSLYIILKKK